MQEKINEMLDTVPDVADYLNEQIDELPDEYRDDGVRAGVHSGERPAPAPERSGQRVHQGRCGWPPEGAPLQELHEEVPDSHHRADWGRRLGSSGKGEGPGESGRSAEIVSKTI